MANKRMFSMTIVDSDAFLDMPLSTQCLYFHLNMRADDDGFIGNPKKIMRIIGSSDDDLKLLIAKRFVLTFEDGVIVIKHWRIHNCISRNRYQETQYIDQKNKLLLTDNKSYSLSHGAPLADKWRTDGAQVADSGLGLDIGIDIDLDKGLDKDKDLGKEKVKKEKYFPDDALNQTLVDYIAMRKQIKKPMTDRAIELAIKKLHSLADDPVTNEIDTDRAAKILEQSIMNSWQGLFDLKDTGRQHGRTQSGIDWSRV